MAAKETGVARSALSRILDGCENVVRATAVGLLGLVVLTMAWQVLARYVTKSSAAWAPDLAVLCFMWLSMAAIALGTRRSRHIRVDLWSERASRVVLVALDAAATTVVVAVCVALTWFGIDSLRIAFLRTLPGLGISAGWGSLAIPVGFGLSAVFAVEAWWDRHHRRRLVDDDTAARATV